MMKLNSGQSSAARGTSLGCPRGSRDDHGQRSTRRSRPTAMKLLLWLLAACTPPDSRQMFRFYPPPGSETATLVIQFTREVDNVHLSINGAPLASGVRTREITVENVPAGEIGVMLAGDGVEKAFGLKIEAGQHMVVPI